mmetsp:Transcript_57575/g.184862  ORF Transcript_57575/g.184862 Transcript_57575/m.184862 type:complete len:201 (+) Transcript_57575:32-634(+)
MPARCACVACAWNICPRCAARRTHAGRTKPHTGSRSQGLWPWLRFRLIHLQKAQNPGFGRTTTEGTSGCGRAPSSVCGGGSPGERRTSSESPARLTPSRHGGLPLEWAGDAEPSPSRSGMLLLLLLWDLAERKVVSPDAWREGSEGERQSGGSSGPRSSSSDWRATCERSSSGSRGRERPASRALRSSHSALGAMRTSMA